MSILDIIPETLELSKLNTWQLVLIGFLLTIVLHQVSIMYIFSPSDYKKDVVIRAAHRAFKEDPHGKTVPPDPVKYKWRTIWTRLLNVYDLKLRRNAPLRFKELRNLWNIDEDEYIQEMLGFWKASEIAGLSGSLFFSSANKHYLMKSLGRTFENRFLHREFLPVYFDYVKSHPDTLLNSVLDILYSFDHRVGEWLKISPSHYIIMENIKFGLDSEHIEEYDLKPTTYLEPYRDLVPEQIQISGVTDVLPNDKIIYVTEEERADLLRRLRADTEFLAKLGCIDYSVLLLRTPEGKPRWALIDCFWSLNESRPKFTKGASDAVRLPQQTVTADAEGYADEVVKLIEGCVRVQST